MGRYVQVVSGDAAERRRQVVFILYNTQSVSALQWKKSLELFKNKNEIVVWFLFLSAQKIVIKNDCSIHTLLV